MKELTKEEKRMYATVHTLFGMVYDFCTKYDNHGEPFECYAFITEPNVIKVSMYEPYAMDIEFIVNPNKYLVDKIRCTFPYCNYVDDDIVRWLLDIDSRNPNKEYPRFWWHGLQIEFVSRLVLCRKSDYEKKKKYYSRRDKLAAVRVTGSYYFGGDTNGTENIPYSGRYK